MSRAEVGVLIQKARLAQRRKDWRTARDLWRSCVEKAPENRTAAIGYISVLIYTGHIEEAATRAEAFARTHPKDENGPIALARIAEARRDFHAAIGFWQAALKKNPRKLQAHIRLGAALVRERRFPEAQACAAWLEQNAPAAPHGAILRAQIGQERDGYVHAASLWEAAAKRFGGNIEFLRGYGRALLAVGAYDECLEIARQSEKLDRFEAVRLRGQVLEKQQPYRNHITYWQNASVLMPDNPNVTRKLVEAALSARQQDKAQAAFRRLLDQNPLRASDADYVVGLGLSYLESTDKALARATVRNFMKGLRGEPDYRAAALRLSRLILACFPRRKGSAISISRTPARSRRMVQNAMIGDCASDVLIRVASLEAALHQSGANCLLDTDIDRDPCRAFVELIRQRLKQGQPFSLIRLGDGEANAFQQDGSFADKMAADASEREKVWWGRPLEYSAREQLAQQVRAASLSSDALGLPTSEWFLRDVRLDGGAPLATTRSGRGLLTVLELLEAQLRTGAFSGKTIVSAHLPQDLERWHLYGALLDGVPEVVLISCHPDLPDAVQARFGIRTAKHILVPPGDAMREIERRALSDAEVPPQSMTSALDEMGDSSYGRLILVGAGYAGKVLIDAARRRGGVALDIGSIFDHWLGIHSRSYQDLA